MHYYDVRNRENKVFLTKQVQETIPFLMGRAISVAFENSIRFGAEIMNFGDKDSSQVYQVIFMEVVGFKVDQVFVRKWLKKHIKKDPSLDLQVMEFLKNKADYVKAKAIA